MCLRSLCFSSVELLVRIHSTPEELFLQATAPCLLTRVLWRAGVSEELPEGWYSAPDMASLAYLDRPFLFPGLLPFPSMPTFIYNDDVCLPLYLRDGNLENFHAGAFCICWVDNVLLVEIAVES